MVINVCYLHLSTFFLKVRICQTQKSDGLSPTDCLHYSHMSQHIPNSDGAGKNSHWGCSFSECKIKPIEKKSIRILILFDMQHQHTLKGLGHNLSQKFRILFFFRFFMFRMVIINALSNFESQRFIELQAKYTEFIVIVYICVALVYVQSKNVFLGG